MNIITQLILICMAIVFVPAMIIVRIQWLVDGEITYYDDDTPSRSRYMGDRTRAEP